jgi:hypothetical protein
MYQEATHKLLIFRNLIKEREKSSINSHRSNNNSNSIYNMNNDGLGSVSTKPQVPDINRHHAKIIYPNKLKYNHQNVASNEYNSNNNEFETSDNNSNENSSINTIIENFNYQNQRIPKSNIQ